MAKIASFDLVSVTKNASTEPDSVRHGRQIEMSEKHISKPAKASPRGRTNWKAVANKTDAKIHAAIAEDSDAAPILGAEWIATATRIEPNKKMVSLRVDPDVLDYFQAQGKGYQTRINAVLRAFVDLQTKQAR